MNSAELDVVGLNNLEIAKKRDFALLHCLTFKIAI